METLDIDPFFSYMACFAVSLGIFHVLFVWPRNLSKRRWKYLDYIWLAVGLLSLISLSSQIRKENADYEEKIAQSRVQGMHELFSSFYINDPSIYFCRQFIRGSLSPSNFDEVQEEFDIACKWSKEFAVKFNKATLPNYSQLTWVQFEPPQFKVDSLNDSLDGMKKQLSYYTSAVSDLELVRHARKPTFVETMLFYLWPYMLGIAIALRMAKTTGEILHER